MVDMCDIAVNIFTVYLCSLNRVSNLHLFILLLLERELELKLKLIARDRIRDYKT